MQQRPELIRCVVVWYRKIRACCFGCLRFRFFFLSLWAMAYICSSGLTPQEAVDIIAEKRKLCFCFSCLLELELDVMWR